ATRSSRLRMDFAEWAARMRTPSVHCAAIRALQALAGAEVARHFAIEADGSFMIDVILIEAR
ncbi:MAG: SAM-dependent methyltransferase, partial [Formivibrio sp.]|nr:SAM-dependent methyltransferase [Formivibrio sp.]